MTKIYAYHGTEKNLTFEELMENDSNGTKGIHFGSKKAAYVAVNKFDDDAENADDETVFEFFESNPECLISVEIKGNVLKASDSEANSATFLDNAINDGFNAISYENEFEDIGSTSYVVLTPECIREV